MSLVIGRKAEQKITLTSREIGPIVITVCFADRGQCRLAIAAPAEVTIERDDMRRRKNVSFS